jgi:Uma2 family endonuclease
MSNAPSKSYVPEGIIPGEPTWDVAQLFPTQGNWSESDYLALDTNRPVEFSHGFVEVLPMPKFLHQRILKFLFNALQAFVTARSLGDVYFMGVLVRLHAGKYREPDVMFMSAEHADRITDEYWEGADLVMEVVSSGNDDRRRDLKQKREEYAQAGIPEYWIVDPELGQITVLTLNDQTYVVHCEFKRGDQAASKLLPGFAVDVASALDPKR